MFSPFITWAANGMLKKAAPTSAPKAATPPLPVFLLLLATRGLSTVISHSRFCRLALALAAALVLALLHVASLSKPIAPPSLPFFAHSNSLEDSPMSLAKQRAVSAVVGGFVADAATMGLHWIYDQEKLQTLVATTPDAPEFHEPPACPFYQYNSGAFSPYGDEVFPLLKDVATRGTFDAAAFATVSYEAAKSYTGRLNSVFRELVKKGDAGETYPNLASESKDLHGGIKVPVLVAKYLDDTATLVAKTKEATRVHQIGVEAEEASVASALLLQQLVLGVPIKDAVAALTENELVGSSTRTLVQEVLDAVRDKTYANSVAAIEAFGKACPLPGSLKGALFVLLTSSGYADAVRANMLAGGDNCSRSILIGACAAAAAASDPIPPQWKQKTTHFDEVRALAEKLVA